MLTIRLTRKGKKNQPFFRVVLIDKRRSSKGGRAVEDLGYVDPLTKRRSLKKERVQYWLSKGAKPSATINNLLIQEKIIEGKKIHVSKISKKKQIAIDAKKAAAVPAVKAEVTPAVQPEPEKTEEPKPEEIKGVEAPKEEAKPEEAEKPVA